MSFDGSKESIFSILPMEIVSYILDFLPYPDFKRSRLVCKQWYIASQDPLVVEREMLKCDESNFAVFSTTLLKSQRHFPHVCFTVNSSTNTDVWYNREFWCHFGPHFKTMTFKDCYLWEEQFLRVLLCCSGLQMLIISGSSFELFGLPVCLTQSSPELLKLTHLQLLCSSMQSALFEKMLAKAPQLKSLMIEESVLTDGDKEKTWQTLLGFFQRNPDRSYNFIAYFAKELFDSAAADCKYFLEIAKNVSVASLRTDHVETVLCMASSGHQKELDFLEILDEEDGLDVAESICSHFTNLTGLCASAHYFSETNALRKAVCLQNLTMLLLWNCVSLQDSVVLAAMCSEVNPRMKHLMLANAVYLSPKCVVELAKTHPSLKLLDLSRCGGVNDNSVQAIFRYQPSLRGLKLRACSVGDTGLLGLVSNRASKVEKDVTAIGCGITALTGLVRLNLSSCRITNRSLQGAIILPKLQHLDIGMNEMLSSKGFRAVIENNPSLNELVLAGCTGLKNEDIAVMLRSMKRFKMIDISFCPQLSMAGVSLLKNCGIPELQVLTYPFTYRPK